MVCRIGVVLGTGLLSGFLVLTPASGQPRAGPQKEFSTPGKAAEALGAAYKVMDVKALVEILGPGGHRLVSSGDAVEDGVERDWFLSLYEEGNSVFLESESRAVLQVGKEEQPYPIPIVKRGEKWRFDPSEGHEELLSRRMRKNELSALNMVVAFVEAQKEYHRTDHDGDGVFEYAQTGISSEGTHDGLYWKARPGEEESPWKGLGELVHREGCSVGGTGSLPFRGYYYRVLKGQGPNAPGGAFDYLVNGDMVRGFGLVSYPARYNVSGIMTFLVNQDGVVYQKDLGSSTSKTVQGMTSFDPDRSWSRGRE